MAKVHDPVPVQAFLWWLWHRVEREMMEIDSYPAIAAEGLPADVTAKQRVMFEIGWGSESAFRRLHRWTHPDQGDGHSGYAERALIEDALFSAGVAFSEVYPDLPEPKVFSSRAGVGRYMTDQQVIAAHTVYIRAKLSAREVAALVQARYGHASVEAADIALRTAWRNLGLPLRQCPAIAAHGGRCRKPPLSGNDHCTSHAGLTGWRIPREMVDRARVMHESGAYFADIAMALLPETPFRNHKWLAKCLAETAACEGWHRTAHLGQRRVHYPEPLNDSQAAA